MLGFRVKTYLFWSGLLFTAAELTTVVLVALLGLLVGIVIAAVLVTVYAYFVGFKAVIALKKDKEYSSKMPGWTIGVMVAILAGFFGAVLNYALTRQISFNTALLPLLGAAIGGYRASKRA